MDTRKLFLVVTVALALLPATAFAQRSNAAPQGRIEDRTPQDALVPFVGFNFGGQMLDSVDNVLDIDISKRPKVYGASLLVGGAGLMAWEFDFGYNPEFYGPKDELGSDSNLMTLTVNLVAGPTFYIGESVRARPYVLVGAGLMRTRIKEFLQHIGPTDPKNLGVVDAGGGFYFYFRPRIGVRADVRYFKGVGAGKGEIAWAWIEGWNYYRATIGVALAF